MGLRNNDELMVARLRFCAEEQNAAVPGRGCSFILHVAWEGQTALTVVVSVPGSEMEVNC